MSEYGGIQLDAETLEEMLGLSTVPEERARLKEQLEQARLLGKSAIGYNPYLGRGRGAKAHIGGAAGAFAQGLQGYMSGKLDTENKAAETDIQGRERRGREAWMRARYGQPGGPGATTITPYSDPGQPEVNVLPPEEEQYPQYPEEDY